MRLGFIGLGTMGLPMAGHLVAAGHTVTVSSRSQAPVDKAVDGGALDGGGPEGVAAASEVIVLCLPDTPDVIAVIDSMLAFLAPGTVVVNCSTIDPEAEKAICAKVQAAGGDYLDAPISGGSMGAAKGTLCVMVGGDPAALEKARPALEPFSSTIVHLGPTGSGQVVKLGNNLLFAAQMAATAEAFTMIKACGVDLQAALEVLSASTGNCTAVQGRIPFEGIQLEAPPSNGWKPGFATELMLKDLRLALAHGERVNVPMRATVMTEALHAQAVEAGYGREDMSAVGKVVRAEAGLL